MLERRLEEELLISLLDWEHFSILTEKGISLKHMEVQVVDDAVSTHGIVT